MSAKAAHSEVYYPRMWSNSGCAHDGHARGAILRLLRFRELGDMNQWCGIRFLFLIFFCCQPDYTDAARSIMFKRWRALFTCVYVIIWYKELCFLLTRSPLHLLFLPPPSTSHVKSALWCRPQLTMNAILTELRKPSSFNIHVFTFGRVRNARREQAKAGSNVETIRTHWQWKIWSERFLRGFHFR